MARYLCSCSSARGSNAARMFVYPRAAWAAPAHGIILEVGRDVQLAVLV